MNIKWLLLEATFFNTCTVLSVELEIKTLH